MSTSPSAYRRLFGKRFHPQPRPWLLWVTDLRKRRVTKRWSPRNAGLALVCRKELAHPVTLGCTISTNSCGLLGARRDGTDCRRFRMVCWVDLAGNRSMAWLPLLGLWRFTQLQPRTANPSVTRVTRVLSRWRV